MDYVKLGNTGLDISPICLGAMSFGEPSRGYPAWTLPEADARPLIKAAVEAGINFFDTANGYSDGSSEEILGRALRGFAAREDVVIATKVYHPMRPGRPNSGGLSRKAIMTEVDASLARLGTDYIDLWQIHRFDETTPLEETLEALHDVVKSGKVRYIGASSMHAWQFAKALHLQRMYGWTRFVSMQDHYSLLNREEEREMLPLCADEKIGVIPWSPLARGKLTRDWDETTHRSNVDAFSKTLYQQEESEKAIVQEVAAIAAERGVSRAQVALAWVSHNPVVSAPIVGVTKPHHLQDAIASLEVHLSDDEVARLEAPYAPQPLAGF
ncbi:aldo/keto reductase [Streptomyces gibsoniae]|uniref:Aldo/keto reductase n=1 Tax=Streptomyces gibsoniae TaxID=3075529 RepID=A0ABU2U5I5_9ACTN|nr:aldo/keto reductase [Streptomyces sp. DSM 41699]MDT0468433.1 aldo/keto reductase [Streptomyces sp. DSM 41699]